MNEGGGQRVVLRGDPVRLKAREAVALGMAFHELFTNALKYGALSNAHGTVSLSWSAGTQAEPVLRIVWQEQGGPPVAQPSHAGFGSLMLERVLKGDLNADVRLDFQPSGVICSIAARLPSDGK